MLYSSFYNSLTTTLYTHSSNPWYFATHGVWMWDPHLSKDISAIENVHKFALRICSKQWRECYSSLLDIFQTSSLSRGELPWSFACFSTSFMGMCFLPSPLWLTGSLHTPTEHWTKVNFQLLQLFQTFLLPVSKCRLEWPPLWHFQSVLIGSVQMNNYAALDLILPHLLLYMFSYCRFGLSYHYSFVNHVNVKASRFVIAYILAILLLACCIFAQICFK